MSVAAAAVAAVAAVAAAEAAAGAAGAALAGNEPAAIKFFKILLHKNPSLRLARWQRVDTTLFSQKHEKLTAFTFCRYCNSSAVIF